MTFTDKQKKLLDFVKQQHGDQQRKYSNEPYWHHVVSVAETASKRVDGAIEIALCHDLFEDTPCSYQDLQKKLGEIGYSKKEASEICDVTKELTDVYIKEDYPELNRKTRKEKEAKRLGKISSLGQSIKYADLIDNTSSIVENDRQFAKVYIQEAIAILDQMRKGNIHLLMDCCYTIKLAMKQK